MKIISLLHYKSAKCTENAIALLKRQIEVLEDADDWRLIVFVAQDNGTEELILPDGVTTFGITNHGFTPNWNEAFAIICQVFPGWTHFGFFNNDIIPDKDFVKNMLLPFEDASVGLSTGAFNSPHKFLYIEEPKVVEVPYVEFTAPVISRGCFDRVGKLNDRFKLGWGVDLEYCLRARNAGFKCVVNGKSRFKHLEHKSIDEFKKYAQQAWNEMKRGLVQSIGSDWKSKIMAGFDRSKFTLPF